MRRIAAWVSLAVLTSGCGLTVGIRSASDADGSDPPGIQVAASADIDRPDASSTTVADTDAEGTPSPIDPLTEGESTGTTTDQSTDASTGTTIPESTPTTDADSTTSTTNGVDETTTTTTPTSTSTTEAAGEVGTVFAEDEAFVTHQCDGNGVTISGDAGDYTLEGSCGAVVITGSFNTVFIDDVDSIDLTGTLNAVVYSSGDPVINDADGDNIVTGG